MPHEGQKQHARVLIPQKEAAHRLSISERTFRSLVTEGKIPVVRVSTRRVAIDPADLDAYIDRQRSEA